ncbi:MULTISPECIES: glycosyltransferase [unclassified Neptuniibacter]|uniref:glycosyltransferase family 32 protein n=1 Tax=unclassified Neptuniibacter TaxID=2630693 RepID=UPI0025CE4692|nr:MULTISPECIES: glycosyltransferase [unclassified Neptuniibacter]|tara:strand:+ start:14571 stop:15350 length:780 start_codon:yes stop_codon:yes gene_type:complete
MKMPFKIILANRLLKLTGALIKAFSFLFHFVFPKKRFTIPKQSDPLIKSKKSTKIPKIIWQTNYTNSVSFPVYCNYLCNRLISPDFEYRYVSTEDRLEFIKEHAPKEISEAYEKLTDGAAQADLWRMITLNYHGGIYMDIDAHAVWPISKMINEDDEEVFLLNKEHYTNYFIASTKNNRFLEKTIEIIISNIQNKNIGRGVYDLTGPAVFNDAIGEEQVNHRYYKITCIQGSFTNEHFQYIDKPRGKWTHAKKEDLLKD